MPSNKDPFSYDWERAVTAALYREYRSILRNHKVSLCAVAIQLMDSDSLWGRWDPSTRTIWIARKLIHNHSWFYVQAILRHEMAHQMVDEFYGSSTLGDKPHGTFFRLACQQLGVLDEFTGASVQLQETSLDWRTAQHDDAAEKLLDKTKKLLALATSSNEHEALLAMNKVRELYAKYNLEQAEEKKSKFVHTVITHGKKRIETHQDRILSILVEHFFVEVLVSKLFDAESGEYHRAIELIGTRENVLMADYVYHFLLQQLDFWIRETFKTAKRKISRLERKSFRLGILSGFSDKLKQSEKPQSSKNLVHPSSSQETAVSVISKALSKFRNDEQLKDYLATIYPRIGSRSSSGQYVDDYAFTAGKTVGQAITLNKAVSTESKSYGHLIEKF